MKGTRGGQILFCLTWYTAVWANNVKPRVQRDINGGPHYNSSYVREHKFLWRLPSVNGGRTFEETLRSSLGQSDFLYIFTGDTQHWHPCTADNEACHRATNNCLTNAQMAARECHQKQSEFSNKLQQISMAALNRRLLNGNTKTPILGLVINGDLTEFGHDDELARLEKLWTNSHFDNMIKIYPGLGNHDYANNVDDCFLNRCASRTLKWFKTFVKEKLKLPLDLRSSSQTFAQESNIGSLAYSWDECTTSVPSQCFHFIQLNYHPTYVKHIDGIFGSWKILASLNWLRNDLKQAANKSIIVNFHDYDNAFTDTDKKKLWDILDSRARMYNIRVWAIFFAHFHHMVGIRDWWCIAGKRVPLLYSGSVPGNNYIVVHFSPMGGNMKKIYSVHVDSEVQSSVDIQPVPEMQEACLF